MLKEQSAEQTRRAKHEGRAGKQRGVTTKVHGRRIRRPAKKGLRSGEKMGAQGPDDHAKIDFPRKKVSLLSRKPSYCEGGSMAGKNGREKNNS